LGGLIKKTRFKEGVLGKGNEENTYESSLNGSR
jgi:hypothetical protein